jgi:hypothetical protein
MPCFLTCKSKIGVGEAAGTPVFRGYDLARLGRELGTNLTAPRAIFEALVAPRCLLNGCDFQVL